MNQLLDTFRLQAVGQRQIVITRDFDASRRAVFGGLTRPERVRRWLLGPPGWSMVECQIDLQVGGAYRYVWRHVDGRELGMGGVYREIVIGERIVATERFDNPWYEGGAVDTVEFREQGGVTTLILTVLYDSREIRDAVLRTPMESGVALGFDNLERLLPTIAAG